LRNVEFPHRRHDLRKPITSIHCESCRLLSLSENITDPLYSAERLRDKD
jgi:hypothetical protein